MTMMVRYIAILTLLLFCRERAFAQSLVITTPTVQLIGKNLMYYEDTSRILSLNEAIAKKDEFKPSTNDVFVHYATPSKFWFYFTLENQTNVDLWIDIANSNLTNIDLYTLDENFTVIDSLQEGRLLEKASNNKGYTFQSLLIDRDCKEKRHFFMNVDTRLVYEVPLFVGSVSEIMHNRNFYDYTSLMVIGALFLMLLYNIFIYFVTHDKIYIYYSLYLFSAAICGTYLNNFPFVEELVGKNIAYNYLDTWLWSIFITTGLFTIRYFDLRKTDRTFYYVILLFFGAFFGFGIANLFLPLYYLANIFQVVAILFYVSFLVFSYRLLLRGIKRARLYCFGWTFMMLGALLYILVYNGLLPYNAFTRDISYYGTLVEILIFSIALGRRITDLQKSQAELYHSLLLKNDELVEVNESLDSFNYHVSHDLKTVLNNTTSLSRMAKKYMAKKDFNRVDEIIGKLEKVALNGTETVQSFLSLGRLDTILKENNQFKINLASELKNVIEQHNLTALIEVTLVEDQLGDFNMHPKAFESIFLNFLTNSIKYTTEPPKAWVKFLKTEEGMEFSYRDNGRGIDLEKYGAELFKPFQRAGTDETYEGTGVGLYLVKRIITNLGGTIDVTSELGKGTEFTIKFINH